MIEFRKWERVMVEKKEQTDYGNLDNWMVCSDDRSLKADVFYLYPTAYFNQSNEDLICSVNHQGMRKRAKDNVLNKGSVFKGVANYYVPYYRQASLEYLVKQEENNIDLFIDGPVRDTLNAFKHYMNHYNNGRPFILAGHSQGSILLLILLASIFKDHPDYGQLMVAAYVIGYGVSKTYMNENPHLKFASGEKDTGVIISYNTESPGMRSKNITVPPDSLLINPISWKCDQIRVPASMSLGSRLVKKDSDGQLLGVIDIPHYADARIDKDRGVIICSTANPEDFRIVGGQDHFPLGILHNGDYSLYYYDLRENAKKRIEAFLNSKMIASLKEDQKNNR